MKAEFFKAVCPLEIGDTVAKFIPDTRRNTT